MPVTATVLDVESKEYSAIDGKVDVVFSFGDNGTIEQMLQMQVST